MNINNISLPYPVLGISDDIIPALPENAIQFSLSADMRNYNFEIELNFNNQDIQYLIDDELAEFSCEYECARTMLRNCLTSKSNIFKISIPRNHISGRINFNCFISVKASIPKYKNKGFNADYDGYTFNMEPGDILAYFPSFHYDADIRYDKLQAAGSFMQIRESSLHSDVYFDIAGNKIEILLPKEHYELYCNPNVKGEAEIIHSSLVLNALTFALLNIESHEQTTWAKTIYYRLDTEEGISREDLDDPSAVIVLAQKLLKDPYKRLFNKMSISNLSSSED
jgi:hypothetical protein